MNFDFNTNTNTLLLVAFAGIGFFSAGIFDILDLFMVKILLFFAFIYVVVLAFYHGYFNNKKNRLEDVSTQDDID